MSLRLCPHLTNQSSVVIRTSYVTCYSRTCQVVQVEEPHFRGARAPKSALCGAAQSFPCCA